MQVGHLLQAKWSHYSSLRPKALYARQWEETMQSNLYRSINNTARGATDICFRQRSIAPRPTSNEIRLPRLSHVGGPRCLKTDEKARDPAYAYGDNHAWSDLRRSGLHLEQILFSWIEEDA